MRPLGSSVGYWNKRDIKENMAGKRNMSKKTEQAEMETASNNATKTPEAASAGETASAPVETEDENQSSQPTDAPNTSDADDADKDADVTDRLSQLEEENARLKDQLLRVQADLENTRRRSVQEVEKARKYGMERLLEDLLPVLDSLELGLQSIDAHGEDVSKIREGYEMIAGMFSSVMEKFGIKVVDPQGEPFDPELHQAMTTEASNEVKPNHVLKVFQKGYILHDRLVRPAMVVIAVEKKDTE
ncbi:MAG: nucleotide exchange factor GrpE [Gammaproteobacteria bacterium]|nr:MAG: nucleotide exchange factor GrpE [Gammaproteobacteria bacterium]